MATDKAWSRRLRVAFSKTLAGDRINLPPSVIDEFFSPASVSNGSPLTFEIVNSHSSVRVYGTVREFTAADDSVEVSAVLGKALELEEDVEGRYVTIRKVSLEKGAFAKLAPLDAEYLDISDLRSTLESHLRQNYATLTAGETISVLEISPVTHQPKEYRFLISQLQAEDNKEVPGCLIVETDIAVDIVPLDSAFAEEAVQRKRLLEQNKAGSVFAWNGNATNIIQGEVDAGAYQYFHMPTLAGSVCYEIKLQVLDGDADLFVSSHFDRPSERDHSHFNVDVGTSMITVEVDSSEAAFLYIGVRGYASKSHYQLNATVHETTEHGATASEETAEPGTRRCPNCSAQVKEQAYIMHEAFCLRNNSVCPLCKKVMTKSDYQSHWHCDKCAKREFCTNQHCATGTKAAMDPTSAALKAVELIKQSVIGNPTKPQYYLCSVAESNAYKRRIVAESLQDLGFTLAWCVKALQECRDDPEGAATWLLSNAPQNVAP
ncbi:ubiquitin fusion degradation protein UFD1-domain-containing protein [Gaertneriomyces semiglobifer]|nr:ubiquitin fusion degradation protein UFD1-domain-containing protein [Gaertneriomyces semiglobifer]